MELVFKFIWKKKKISNYEPDKVENNISDSNIICVKSFSQTTTTILYDASSNLSTTKCNVFDPPVNVGGKLHTGVIGGARFSRHKTRT